MARELPFKFTKAERVFKLRYSIRIPKVYTYDPKFLEQYQPVQTGEQDIDETLFKSPIDMLVTPAGMAMYLAEGASFQFNKLKDIVPIYEDVYELLVHVVETLNSGFIPKFQPPIKDIISLDTLCGSIYNPYMGLLELQQKTGVPFEDLVNDFSATRELEEAYRIVKSKGIGSIEDISSPNRLPYSSTIKMLNNRAWGLYGNSRYNIARYRQ